MRILILGGSTEASTLAQNLAGVPAFHSLLSLAGRTRNPGHFPIPTRVGGFGGVAGLCAYLRQEAFDLVVDATHPFAERMSANAASACRETCIPLVMFKRPPWQPQPGDNWRQVADASHAAAAIGQTRRRVFLTVGRLQLAAFEAAPHHDYLIRTIDPPHPAPRLPSHRVMLARGPFSGAAELELLRREAVDVLITKNSGGEAARPKLDAARECGVNVILIQPPTLPQVTTLYDVRAVMHCLNEIAHGRLPPEPGTRMIEK